MIPSITAAAILAGTIRRSLATISSTASHTTGTAIGDDGMGNQIGMAPGAKWIGCRNMDQGNGTPARYMECMEFFLAPYPINCTPAEGDPTKAPDITINSWGCPLRKAVRLTRCKLLLKLKLLLAFMMVVAAGNSGSACSTVTDPPSFYAASYTVGALNTGTDTIASFSSRGPVTVDGSNRIKPDITAPGTGTRSAQQQPATMHIRLPAARPWRLRISPAPWRCSGGPSKFAAPDYRESRCLEQRGCLYLFHPVRHSGTPKQRIWLGPDRYRGRCRNAVTNSVAQSYANSNRYTFCMRRGNGNADANGFTNLHRSIRDQSNRREHRARDDGHRQSRG